jgi:flagellar biosynthesis/type III secretory pathway protein FliH
MILRFSVKFKEGETILDALRELIGEVDRAGDFALVDDVSIEDGKVTCAIDLTEIKLDLSSMHIGTIDGGGI